MLILAVFWQNNITLVAKRKSGNGTSNRQWLYILANFPFLWIVKVGITGQSGNKRRKQIDKSAPGWDFTIFKIKIRWAYQAEQFIHFICSFMQVGFWGSGKTERFFFLAAIPALIVSLLIFLIEWSFYLTVFFGICYLLKG